MDEQPPATRYIDVREAIEIYARTHEIALVDAVDCIRDRSLLASALLRPRNVAHYAGADLVDQAAILLWGLLETVRRHLAPGGLFAFETRFPIPSELLTPETLTEEWTEETVWRQFEDERGQTVTVSTAQCHDVVRQIVEYVIYRCWQEGGSDQVRTERAALRFVYPQEMEALLRYNGLAIRDAYGDWDRRPLDGTSSRMIYVCQARS